MDIRVLTKISIFTVILSILSIISIPIPFGVPLTLQTFGVALCGFILGKKNGTICIAIYILLGAIGIPIFSGMSGGFSKIFGLNGGFIFGFLFLAFFSGFKKNTFSFLGLFICHILGIIQFSFISKISFKEGFLIVSLPYILKDIISIILAYMFKKMLFKRIKI